MPAVGFCAGSEICDSCDIERPLFSLLFCWRTVDRDVHDFFGDSETAESIREFVTYPEAARTHLQHSHGIGFPRTIFRPQTGLDRLVDAEFRGIRFLSATLHGKPCCRFISFAFDPFFVPFVVGMHDDDSERSISPDRGTAVNDSNILNRCHRRETDFSAHLHCDENIRRLAFEVLRSELRIRDQLRERDRFSQSLRSKRGNARQFSSLRRDYLVRLPCRYESLARDSGSRLRFELVVCHYFFTPTGFILRKCPVESILGNSIQSGRKCRIKAFCKSQSAAVPYSTASKG